LDYLPYDEREPLALRAGRQRLRAAACLPPATRILRDQSDLKKGRIEVERTAPEVRQLAQAALARSGTPNEGARTGLSGQLYVLQASGSDRQ
jgi:hypothetical protein